jgi:sigma-E factor negative regulatory protein RseA
MDTPQRLREPVSALVDGETPDDELGFAMAALATPEGQAAWHAYHLIGDVLRADASGAELGEGFSARLAARLDDEPAPHGDTLATAGAPAAPVAVASSPEVPAARAPGQPATL